MTPIERVRQHLDRLPFRLEIIQFDASTHTSALAAQALGVEVGQIAKSVLFVGKTKAALVVTSGDRRVSPGKVKQVVGEKVRLAQPDEVEALTGFSPGGVCPFGMSTPVSVLVDESLNRFPVVYAAAGTPASAIPVTVEQLVAATGGKLCDLG